MDDKARTWWRQRRPRAEEESGVAGKPSKRARIGATDSVAPAAIPAGAAAEHLERVRAEAEQLPAVLVANEPSGYRRVPADSQVRALGESGGVRLRLCSWLGSGLELG